MQWNARSAVANKLSLDKFLHDNQIDIALISETWFKPNINIRFKEYSIIRRDRHDGKTGVAIFVRNTLNFEEITSPLQSDDIQVCGAEISIADSLHLSLLSVYVPPGTNIFPNNWARLLTLSNQHAIIGGDFNAHHGLWGSYKQNHNGVSLVEALNSADLVLLNDGSPTRFQNNENNSVVDLTFASPDIANIIEWRTHDDTLGSDHYPILLEIKLQSASNGHVITPKNKWNTDKANWNLYHHYCDNFFNNCPPAFQNTDEKYQFFIQGINEAALKSIPPYKPFTKKNSAPAPWWDQECEEAINNRKREFRKYKQQSNVENYVFCKREIAKTKRILKNKAKLYWIKYCNNLNKNTPCSDLWSQAKRMQRMQVNYNKCNNLDWEEHFFNKIAPCSTTQDSADMFLRQDCNTSSFLSQHITINELEYALRNANNSSPGLDNITYSMIWHLPNNALRLCLGAMKSTPVEPLRIESLEYPLKIRRELIASKFILKNRVKQNELSTRIVELNVNDLTNKYWIKKQSPPLCSAFRSTAEQELRLEQFEVPKETSNFFHMLSKQEIITPEFNQNVPNVSSSTLSETLDQFQNYELIFTDASKSNEGTGCAFYVASNGTSKMFKLSESTSIFSAEAIGILKAIEYVEEKSMLKTVILSLSFCFKIIF
nr:unnamed protein product [Callosobruchus analis]